jgi:cytochrome c-type biogenesis protein CcmE
MKTKYIIGTIIVLVFVGWGISAFFKTTVRYVSFDEARSSTRVVQVAGEINQDNVIYDEENKRLLFTIYEMDSENPANHDSMNIVYNGVVPGNFRQATSVLVRGKSGDDAFEAEKLLVKCPSKYQGLTENSQDNK